MDPRVKPAGDRRRSSWPRPVIAGLDPAIHPLTENALESCEDGWTRGASPRGTGEGRGPSPSVLAGIDPAVHPLTKIPLSLAKMMDHPNSGLPEFGRFECASRKNPTCVVKPVGDARLSR